MRDLGYVLVHYFNCSVNDQHQL